MRKMLAILAFAPLVACRLPHAPATLYVDPGFSADTRAVLDDALDAWCEAVRWCPEIVERPADAEAKIWRSDDFAERWPDRVKRGVLAFNNGTDVVVAPNAAAHGLDVLWHTLAHEVGHFCIVGHRGEPGPGALMAETLTYDELSDGSILWHASTSLDQTSISAWLRGCGENS